MFDPERRAALRTRAESFKSYHFAAAGGETVRRLAADVLDLLAALETAEARAAELLDLVADLTAQGCGSSDGSFDSIDSMALRDYADALRVLAEAGRVEIVSEHGRRVIARWKEPEGIEGRTD